MTVFVGNGQIRPCVSLAGNLDASRSDISAVGLPGVVVKREDQISGTVREASLKAAWEQVLSARSALEGSQMSVCWMAQNVRRM